MAIQIRRGTDAEWESNKSNIVAGEPAIAMDTERMFIGTGSGTYMEVANIEVLADAFDSSASYVVGDFVSYHGKVYKCNTDHSGAWNASHFDEVALADALDALGDDVYTKDETDALLALKADKSTTYTKTEVNTALDLKADKSNTYTKTQVDTALNLKADKSDTYTKAQVDSIVEAASTIEDGSITIQKLYCSEAVEPSNWLNVNAITDGELAANGTISESTTRFYTDYIPVSEGDSVRGYRSNPIDTVYRRHICFYDSNKNVVSGGSDSASRTGYTIPAGVSFVRVTFDKNILPLNPMIVLDGQAPTVYSAYFEPYYVLTDDLVTPESKAILVALKNKELGTKDLANSYGCAIPRQDLRMTVGIPETWYFPNMVTPPTDFISIGAGVQYSQRGNGCISYPNEEAFNSVNGFSWTWYDVLLNQIEQELGSGGYGFERHIVAENLSNCTALVMGDSTVDFDTMTQKMLDYFTSKNKTLTLLGTLGDGTAANKNEGRSGWKASDYLTNKQYGGVTNPFYNPTTQTFDFSYYMTQQGYSAPDFVVIQLGINDLYNYDSSAIVPTWDCIKTMIDSILAYDNTIKILLNLPTAPNSDQTKHTIPLFLYCNRVIKYNEYAIAQAKSLYGSTKVRPSYCHLILDPDTDIRDNVHPTAAGFEKMALELINQINCWQNGV